MIKYSLEMKPYLSSVTGTSVSLIVHHLQLVTIGKNLKIIYISAKNGHKKEMCTFNVKRR